MLFCCDKSTSKVLINKIFAETQFSRACKQHVNIPNISSVSRVIKREKSLKDRPSYCAPHSFPAHYKCECLHRLNNPLNIFNLKMRFCVDIFTGRFNLSILSMFLKNKKTFIG